MNSGIKLQGSETHFLPLLAIGDARTGGRSREIEIGQISLLAICASLRNVLSEANLMLH